MQAKKLHGALQLICCTKALAGLISIPIGD
jgi:hypothetical protein